MSNTNSNPSGWTTVRLGDVGQWFGGGTPSKFEPRFWTGGTTPWVSPKDMKSLRIIDSEDHLSQSAIDETSVREFPRGTVLLVIRSGILSRTLPVGVAEVPGTMNQDLKGVRPAKGIESMFLAYQLIGREREVLNKCSKHGTTVASIDTERLRDFEIRLAPTPEQRRIVAKIEELFSDLDAGVAALERVRANLKRYRAAVLKAAVEGRLTEEWRTQHPATEPAAQLLERILAERRAKWEQDQLRKFKESGKTPPKGWKEKYRDPAKAASRDGIMLPPQWCWATIDQITHLVTKGSSPGWQGFEYTTAGAMFVRSQNVRWGHLDLSDVQYLPPEFNVEHPTSIIRTGDVLLNLVGASVGRAAVATEQVDGANLNQAVGIIRLVNADMNRLLVYFIVSPQVQAHITTNKADVARANFNLDDVRPMPMALPPLAEQAEIVAEVDRRLSVADAAEQQVEHALQHAARLRQAILKRAFEGKLVPQDPTDEPAAARLGAREALTKKLQSPAVKANLARSHSNRPRALSGKHRSS